ncbi:hypothetical protein [Methylobacter luteus]|uniref:hypothetical protein n=1 Tax=Methylobacter luteus TaxID=415 RepID=UPI0003FE9A97|nr:hypothetical protein [Methylobacter luteus]
MIADISPKREREFSALWNEGRFERIHSITFEGYCVLSRLLEKCESTEDAKLIEWALPAIKAELTDMNTFRAAKTAGAEA